MTKPSVLDIPYLYAFFDGERVIGFRMQPGSDYPLHLVVSEATHGAVEWRAAGMSQRIMPAFGIFNLTVPGIELADAVFDKDAVPTGCLLCSADSAVWRRSCASIISLRNCAGATYLGDRVAKVVDKALAEYESAMPDRWLTEFV